jgi:hypothetical protein
MCKKYGLRNIFYIFQILPVHDAYEDVAGSSALYS